MRDIMSGIAPSVLIAPASRASNTAATGAIKLDSGAGIAVLFLSGAITDGTVTCKLQDSPDGSTWTDVPATNMVGGVASVTLAATDDNVVKELGYLGAQPWVQAVMTQSSAVTGGVYGAVAVVGALRMAP